MKKITPPIDGGPSILQQFNRTIRARLIGGVLLVIPIAVTWFIVKFFYTITVGALVPLFQRFDVGAPLPTILIPAISLLATLMFLYLVGLLAGNYLGRRFIGLGESILRHIPVVKTVYAASKQVVETFAMQNTKGFKRVGLIEFPRKGLYTVGFITADLTGPTGEPMYAVFVPTTPNPTGGYVELVSVDEVVLLDMTVEEAIKMIMSSGILAPDALVPASQGRQTQDLVEVEEADA